MMKQIAVKIAVAYLILVLSFNIAAFAQGASAADFLFEIGKEYYEAGDYQQALHELNKAILAEPGHPQALKLIERIEQEWISAAGLTREEVVAQALAEAEAKIAGGQQITEPKKIMPKSIAPARAPAASDVELYDTVEEKRTLVELYNKYYWYNTQFDGSGNRRRWAYNGRYHEVRTELKVERNLTENLNFLFEIPYKIALWKDDYNRNTTSGIGDIWLKAKCKLFDQPVTPYYFAIQPGIRFPGGYDKGASPALGKGEVAAELRFIAARSSDSLPIYSKAELAYRLRADDPTDEIPLYFEINYYPTNQLLFKTTIDGVEGLGGTDDDEEDWTKWTVHMIYSPNSAFGEARDEEIWKYEFAYGNTFEGKNTSNGSELVLNISHEF